VDVTDEPFWGRPAARVLLWVVAGVVLLHGVAFVALQSLQRAQGDTVLAGVHVDGHDVGGADRDELVAQVDRLADDRLQAPIEVVASRGSLTTDRASLGAVAHTEEAATAAWDRGRRGLWRALADQLRARAGATIHLDVQVELERPALERWATTTAAELSRPPQDAALALHPDGDEATVEVTEPREGRQVDPDVLADEVEDAIEERGEVRVEVEAEVEDPATTAADLDAVRVPAERVVSGPVRLVNPSTGDDLELTPAALASLVAVTAEPDADEGERLRLGVDDTALRDHLEDQGGRDAYDADPVDATFSVDGDQVEIVGGTPGFTLDVDATAERLLEVATEEEGDPDEVREASLPGETTDPDVPREELEDLGVEEEVSSFTTELTPGEPRNTNIQLGAEILDGTLIEPGERFSLDDHLGPRTRDRGFVENGYIDADGDLTEVVGGGTSQLATTFFNAAWFAGIELIDFQPHSLYFARYPMGREATISRGTIDVLVENDSPHAILVATEASESAVTVRFFSTSWAQVDSWTGEPFDRVEGETRDGFTVEFGRTVTFPDGATREEEYAHRYEPED
jgi:vancomycin resistance protein YoaR